MKPPKKIPIPRRGDRSPSAIKTGRRLEPGSEEFERAKRDAERDAERIVEDWAREDDRIRRATVAALALLYKEETGR